MDYEWIIERCFVHNNLFEKSNVVFMAEVCITATDGRGFVNSIIKRAAVSNYRLGAPFIEFDDLTERDVLQWIKDFYPASVISSWEQEAAAPADSLVTARKLISS